MSSVEDIAGERKGLHPLLTCSPASCWHTAAVSYKPEGHKVRGYTQTCSVSSLHVCSFKLLRNVVYHWDTLASSLLGKCPSHFLIFVLFLFFTENMTRLLSNQRHPHSHLTSSAFNQTKCQFCLSIIQCLFNQDNILSFIFIFIFWVLCKMKWEVKLKWIQSQWLPVSFSNYMHVM